MSIQNPKEVDDKIHLTDVEKQIFERFTATLSHFDLKTQLRVAGGWVRDKLLGKNSDDIDIAIDDMLGSEFCGKVSEYLSSIGEEVRGVGVVPRNPEQSKHLETATMQICDIWIDFVNLRSENYSENSRIPTMRFGTAKEDAYRRDLTINSLFYNINSGSVEDLTGRGIEDLKVGKIVTPLPPKETFLDDPLRVLRAIRFGARFEFILDEELMKSAACGDVKTALGQKISRERIGHEVDLMISGNQPVKAMTYVSNLTLFWVVFSLPPNIEPSTSEECDRTCVTCLDAARSLIELIGFSTFSIPVVNYIFKNSLKLQSSYAEKVLDIHTAAEKFISLIPHLLSNEDTQVDANWGREFIDVSVTSRLRILTGLLLREVEGYWRVALIVSTLIDPSESDLTTNSSYKRGDLFKTVEDAINKLGLDKIWEVKPLVNGREIMNVLQIKTGGPIVKEWQHKLLEWQLAHPLGTSEECLNWMREAFSKRTRLE